MNRSARSIGKGHTLYAAPGSAEEVWRLISESCFEIGSKLLSQGSYAHELTLSLSGYRPEDEGGMVSFRPHGFPRYPKELFQTLHDQPEVALLIGGLLEEIRRLQVQVNCREYTPPLFEEEESKTKRDHRLLESIRSKFKKISVIGSAWEVCPSRLSTYTPRRSDEVHRALDLLKVRSDLMDLLPEKYARAYWDRVF
ncbi:MAG: hypothetical protein HQL31_07130 [Planctomycetes bacterium]|nr:hypothetical protein [Planctomycetota bacterium]